MPGPGEVVGLLVGLMVGLRGAQAAEFRAPTIKKNDMHRRLISGVPKAYNIIIIRKGEITEVCPVVEWVKGGSAG